MIRDFITDHIDTHVTDDTVGLLLSGGVDSISVGISAQDAGRKVHAYSFTLDNHESYDFVKARDVADTMGWEFTPVIIPTANIKQDFQRLVELGCRKKSEFEAAAYPFLYVYDAMVEKYSVTGWVADAYFGASRKATQRYSSFKKKRNYVKWCKESGDKRVNWNEFVKHISMDTVLVLRPTTKLRRCTVRSMLLRGVISESVTILCSSHGKN
jgi:asparagine synthetase B (glutamine-hydrolysing)